MEQHHIYHEPEIHSAYLDNMRVRVNQEFLYGVLVCDDLEKYMGPRLGFIIEKLR